MQAALRQACGAARTPERLCRKTRGPLRKERPAISLSSVCRQHQGRQYFHYFMATGVTGAISLKQALGSRTNRVEKPQFDDRNRCLRLLTHAEARTATTIAIVNV